MLYAWYEWDIWAYSRDESHHKSFKKTSTECNNYLNRPWKRLWRSSPLIIQSVLCYHHIPDEINCTVKFLYCDFRLSIITNDFCTKHIAVEKGVLQGDSISPLIFNLIINNFIQYVKEEKFTNFESSTFKGFFPHN